MTTMTTRKPTRRTAANDRFLNYCRHWFNAKVYRVMLDLVNDPARGEAAARAWLLEHVVRKLPTDFSTWTPEGDPTIARMLQRRELSR